MFYDVEYPDGLTLEYRKITQTKNFIRYNVLVGDTIISIAKKFYPNNWASNYARLFDSNPSLRVTNISNFVGTHIIIPYD